MTSAATVSPADIVKIMLLIELDGIGAITATRCPFTTCFPSRGHLRCLVRADLAADPQHPVALS